MILPFVAKCVVVATALLSSNASAFSVSPGVGERKQSQLQQQQSSVTMTASGGHGRDALPMSRRDVLGAVFGVTASSFAFVAAADAKQDPALKGTKEDPEFVACLSECIYYCTKSKVESKTRPECIQDCRKSCAKTKAQKLVGQPRG